MGIAAMSRLAVKSQQRQGQPTPVRAAAPRTPGESAPPANDDLPAAQPPAPADQQPLETAMEEVTAFVPTEVIGAYIAAVALITPESYFAKWVIFGIALAIIALVVPMSYAVQLRQTTNPPAKKAKVVIWLEAFAVVGFVAWAAALPGSPFLKFHGYKLVYGGVAVLFLAVAVRYVAKYLQLTPSSQS